MMRKKEIKAKRAKDKKMTPHKCPVCKGCGFVPNGFYSTLPAATDAIPETCRPCKGSGVLWSKKEGYVIRPDQKIPHDNPILCPDCGLEHCHCAPSILRGD